MVSRFKGLGYLVSTFSVILLGIVALKGAKEEPWLFICLIAGMAASVAGMGLRWISHRLGEKKKAAIEAKADGAHPKSAAPDDYPGARPAMVSLDRQQEKARASA